MSSFAPPCLHVLTLGVSSSLVFLWVPPRIYSHPLTRIAGKQIWGTFWSPDSRPNALPPAPNTHILMRSFRPGRETISFAWTLSTLVPLWAGRWQEVIEVIECLTGDQNKWNGVLLVCALWQRPERFTVLLSDKHLSKLKWPICNNCTQLGEGIRSADTLSWRDDRLHFSSKLEIGVVVGERGCHSSFEKWSVWTVSLLP